MKNEDSLYSTEAPNGFLLASNDPDFKRQILLAEKIMQDDREILKVLSQ